MPLLCLDSSHRPSAQYPGDRTLLQALWGRADPGTLGTAAVGSSLQIAWAAAHWHQQSAPLSTSAETQNYQGRWWSKFKNRTGVAALVECTPFAIWSSALWCVAAHTPSSDLKFNTDGRQVLPRRDSRKNGMRIHLPAPLLPSVSPNECGTADSVTVWNALIFLFWSRTNF